MLIESGNTWGLCCEKDKVCRRSWYEIWNDQNMDVKEIQNFSDKIIALRKILGQKTFWTSSPYNGTGENSCYAFDLNASHGSANNGFRGSDSIYALCE